MHILNVHYIICRLSREPKSASSLTKREIPLFCGFQLDLDLIQLHSFCKPCKKIAQVIFGIWRKLKTFFLFKQTFLLHLLRMK